MPVPHPQPTPTGSPSPLARPDAAASTAPRSSRAHAVADHHAAIWRYLRMLGASADDADELSQETLLVALRPGLPDEPTRARAFLRGVAKNQWLRTRRFWQRRREREIAAAVDELWLATAEPDDGSDLLQRLQHCLGTLTPRAQQALDLHYRDRLPWQRVAQQLGMKQNGAKTLAQRARQTLRECLDRRPT